MAAITQVSVSGQLKVTPPPTALGALLFAPPATGTVSTLLIGSGFAINSTTGTINVAVTPPPAINFVDAEVPAGATDGTNLVFILANAPNPPSSLVVWRNGLRLMAGGDYTVSGVTITFSPGAQPQATDPLIVSYRH